MEIIPSVDAMQDFALQARRQGRRIGFVPTMGYLHEGHLSLVRIAEDRCDLKVLSIFVNPIQFLPGEDLARYPRDFGRDEALCRAAGVDVIFYPEPADMYRDGFSILVEEKALSQGLCGASRPGHFAGVTTVVAKLFNIVMPDVAVFGQKDAQQARVIRRMARDLNFPVEIVIGPIVREADGLAMSSRNKYLSPREREEALGLRRALDLAVSRVAEGQRDVAGLKAAMLELLRRMPSARVDYIEFVDDDTLAPVTAIDRPVLVVLAVWIGKTRLIDNDVVTPRDAARLTR
jgi:pantoate--beta-alanine ligase